MKVFGFFLIVILFSTSSALKADELDKRNNITKNLRCLVCQGQSVADSNSDFARTLKIVVKDLINEVKNEEQIYSFLSDKYGDWIVFKPSFNLQNSLLWVLPYIVLIFGGFFIFSLLKKRQ